MRFVGWLDVMSLSSTLRQTTKTAAAQCKAEALKPAGMDVGIKIF